MSETSQSSGRVEHFGLRVVVLVTLLVVIGSWSSRHLGTALPGLALLILGFLKKFIDFVGGAEKAEHENRLRSIALFMLGDGFLVAFFLVTLVSCAFVSSVTVLSAGVAGSADVRVAPEGKPLPDHPNARLEGSDSIERIICLTSPLGRLYYLDVEGFQRYSFDLFPWSGAQVRLGRDLRRVPVVLLRVPLQFIPLLGACDVAIRVGDAEPLRVATAATRGSLVLGRPLRVPASLLEEWNGELRAMGLPDNLRESLVRQWREPDLVAEAGAVRPGTLVEAHLLNADGEAIAGASFVVNDDEIQDVLLIAGGGS